MLLIALALVAVPINGSSLMSTVVQAASGNNTVSDGDVSDDIPVVVVSDDVSDEEDDDDTDDVVVTSDGESVESTVDTTNTSAVSVAVATPEAQIKAVGGVAADETVAETEYKPDGEEKIVPFDEIIKVDKNSDDKTEEN